MDNFEGDLESMIQRYVLKQLDSDEAEEFEIYFLSQPDIIEKIEAAQMLRAGMLEIERTADADETSPEGRSLLQTIYQWFTFPVPAFAAIAVALLVPALMVNKLADTPETDQYYLADISSSQTRSKSQISGVDLSSEHQRTAVMLRIKRVTHPLYILRIADSRQTVWESEPFSFASGVRDKLLIVPPEAAIASANLSLIGIAADNSQTAVEFCNYTEACR